MKNLLYCIKIRVNNVEVKWERRVPRKRRSGHRATDAGARPVPQVPPGQLCTPGCGFLCGRTLCHQLRISGWWCTLQVNMIYSKSKKFFNNYVLNKKLIQKWNKHFENLFIIFGICVRCIIWFFLISYAIWLLFNIFDTDSNNNEQLFKAVKI